MTIESLYDEDGRAFYVKGHIDSSAFFQLLRVEVDNDDPILEQKPEHLWWRFVRDFQENRSVLLDAKPGERGAFKVTHIHGA